MRTACPLVVYAPPIVNTERLRHYVLKRSV